MSERDFKVVFLYRLLTISRRGVFAKENPLVNLSFLQLQENKRMIFFGNGDRPSKGKATFDIRRF